MTAPQVILGACRPALAYEALNVDPSVAATDAKERLTAALAALTQEN